MLKLSYFESQSLVNEGRVPRFKGIRLDVHNHKSQSLVNEGRFPPRDPRGSPGVPKAVASQSLVNEGRFPLMRRVCAGVKRAGLGRNPSLMRAGFHGRVSYRLQ